MKGYAILKRVSTDEQSRPGHVSFEVQQKACREFVVAHGGVVIMEEADVDSAFQPARPGYLKVLDAARRREIDAVVSYRYDRFGREPGEAITNVTVLRNMGISVESATEPNDNVLYQYLSFVLGFNESNNTSQRTTAALRERARQGLWSGPPPLGYTVHREDHRSTLLIDPVTAPLIRRVFEAAAAGNRSLEYLADQAAAWGLRGRSGHTISRQVLGRMLRNVVYKGTLAFGRSSSSKFGRVGRKPREEWIVVDNAHDAIVDADTFDSVQAILSRHRREQATTRGTRHLLSSLTWCGRCAGQAGPDGRPKSWRAYGTGAEKGRAYNCSRRRSYGLCDLPSISAPGLEKAVKAEVAASFIIGGDVRSRAARYIADEVESMRSAAERQRTDLERALERHQSKRMALARRLLGEGEAIPDDIYRRLEDEEAAAVQRIEEELRELPTEPPTVDVEPVLAVLESLDWDDLSFEAWREVLVLLIDHVTLMGRGDFSISWQPAADILRKALVTVSRSGSLT